jgi:hypothetical protein
LIALGFIFLSSFSTFAAPELTPFPRPISNTNRKAIVTPLGEVTSNAGYVGESVTYRVYYYNASKIATDLRLVDVLDAGLEDVQVAPPGVYNAAGHTLAWEFEKVAAKTGGFVQFVARLKQAGTVSNKARLHFSAVGKLPVFSIQKYRLQPAGEIAPAAELEKTDPSIKGVTIETNQVSTKVYVDPKLGWIPFDRNVEKGQPPKPIMKDNTTIGAMVNIDIPGAFVRKVKVGKQTFYRFAMPGQASLTEVGLPELPIIGQIIEVPKGVDFSIEVIKAREVALDAYRVYPAQELRPDVKKGDPRTSWPAEKFEQDQTCYLKEASFPETLGLIQTQDIGVIRGHRIVMLKVHPIQTNPVTLETKAYAQIEVRIKYSQLAQVQAIPKRLYSRAFEQLLKRTVLNYQDPKRFDLDIDNRADDGSNKERTGCDYLILTHQTFYNAGDPNNPVVRLASWKQREGLRVRIVDVATIANGQTYNGIKQYLQNAYDTWNLVPSYVLLIGDADLIPVRYLTKHPLHSDTLTGTDLYYSTLDGSDLYPDIYLGRLSVDTLAQATTVIDRILNYEQNPPINANFYNQILFCALFEDVDGAGGNGNGTEDRPWIENVEDVRTYLLGLGYQADRVYTTSSGWPGNPLAAKPANYEDGTALPAALTPPTGGTFGWNGTPNDVSNDINAGRFLVTYRDHGNRTTWQANNFNNTDADNLTNGNLAPVVLDLACQNGWFDNETDDAALGTGVNDECLAEHFIRNANGGAVAIMAACRDSWTGCNDFLMFGMHKAIWPNYVPNPPITGYPAIPTMDSNPLPGMGQIMNFGKFYMCRAYGSSTKRDLTMEIYHLFGDPEMPIWSTAPVRLDATFPEGIGAVGEQHFVVKVSNLGTHAPVNLARVVLTRGNAFVSVQETDAAGIARFKLNDVGPGNLDLTVTSTGFSPFLKTINVSASGATLNRLDPDNGVLNQAVHVGGVKFDGNEGVEVSFDGSLSTTTTATAGSFGQAPEVVDFQVPAAHDLGPVNILAKGKTSGRYGVDLFQVRSANPVDLYLYDQWDSSTWGLHPGDNPTWDNPSIQLYDLSNNAVASDNLQAAVTYSIRVMVHNDTDFAAHGAKVSCKWANFGLGQPPDVWTPIGDSTVDVPAHSVTPFEVKWTTPGTGHLCVMAEIYHIEDANNANNQGQENCHVGPTSSPAKVPFTIWNPTKNPEMVYLDLRQLFDPRNQGKAKLWGSFVVHPAPQRLRPGESKEAEVVIDPDLMGNELPDGAEAEFSLTGYIDGKVIGGVNFRINKQKH